MSARARAVSGLIGFALFVGFGSLFGANFWTAWWFYVGLGITISRIFLEPFFSRPQDAILTGAGAAAIFASASREGAPLLWGVYLGISLIIFVSGALAALLPDKIREVKRLGYVVATSSGRPVLVGASALMLEAVSHLRSDGEYLALGTLGLIAFLTIDWTELRVFAGKKPGTGLGSALAAFGPRMLLVDAGGAEMAVGDRIAVRVGNRSSGGTITSRMPHKRGLRYQLVLDVEWDKLCKDFPSPVRLEPESEPGRVVGTVGENSTDNVLQFEPVRSLRVGDPVEIRGSDNRRALYQVTGVQLRRIGWEGSNALVPHATAVHVGAPRDGFLRFEPWLPDAHQTVEAAGDLSMSLPGGFSRLGIAKGTEIMIGIDLRHARRGHLAILGMSGMGKTAVARRICRALERDALIVAVDTTGEYRSRLGLGIWDGGLDGVGAWVHEPTGDPPKKASELIAQWMAAASAEYSAGDIPRRRVIVLEEAHAFVPEWNFASRNQQDSISYSARMVMQARKFELSFVVVSQRTAVVSKSVLSQCENYIILKTVDETSLTYLEGIFGNVIRQAVPSLQRYEAICAGPAFNSEGPVITRLDAPDA